MKLFDVVALIENTPEHGLRRGQVGTIVETWAEGVFEVEFADMNGAAYAFAALRAEQLMVLQWQPDTQAN